MIAINIDYAANDSCQIQLWARGNHSAEAFLAACENTLFEFDERQVSLAGKAVEHEHWRTVMADGETQAMGVCEYLHVKSKPGRGAYEVTVLPEWLSLHTDEAQV